MSFVSVWAVTMSMSCLLSTSAMEFLNLVNTDEYLRNLLNYGIEGVHWTKAEPTAEEKAAARCV